jgi:carbon storage regulator
MLTFTRRAGERIVIGHDIEITVVSVGGGRVRIGVTAPHSVAIHRGEIVDRIEAENRRAIQSTPGPVPEGETAFVFRDGLFGLRAHTRFVPCDLDGARSLRLLVSEEDSTLRLVIADAATWFPGYPLDEACRVAGTAIEDAIVAIVLAIPADGTEPSANLLAPLVLSTKTRTGVQVVLDGSKLSAQAPLAEVADAALLAGV